MSLILVKYKWPEDVEFSVKCFGYITLLSLNPSSYFLMISCLLLSIESYLSSCPRPIPAWTSVILHLYAGIKISYSHDPFWVFSNASLVWPWSERICNCLYNFSLSTPSCFFQVTAPPSALVRFLTAWNEKHEKSAILPAVLLSLTAPNPCAQSAKTMILPNASCNSLLGVNKSFLLSITSYNLS